MTEEHIEKIAREWCSRRHYDPDTKVTFDIAQTAQTPMGIVTAEVPRNWQPLWTIYAHDVRILADMGVLKE